MAHIHIFIAKLRQQIDDDDQKVGGSNPFSFTTITHSICDTLARNGFELRRLKMVYFRYRMFVFTFVWSESLKQQNSFINI